MSRQAATPADIIASGATGKPVLTIVVPPDIAKPSKYKGGTKFVSVNMTAHSRGGQKFSVFGDGISAPLDIPILFGAPAPGQSKVGENGARVGICFDFAGCGDLGRAIEILDNDFHKQLELCRSQIWKLPSPPKRITSPIRRTYGDSSEKQGDDGKPLAGQLRDKPLISLSADFTTFPSTFKGPLAGTPRTVVYDWSTRVYDPATKKELFKERVGLDGNRLNVENASEILGSGNIVRRIIIEPDGISISPQTGISLRFRISKVWIQAGAVGDISFLSDPDVKIPLIMPDAAATSATASTSAPQVTPAPAPVVVAPATTTVAPKAPVVAATAVVAVATTKAKGKQAAKPKPAPAPAPPPPAAEEVVDDGDYHESDGEADAGDDEAPSS
jgi:hypothetical protein